MNKHSRIVTEDGIEYEVIHYKKYGETGWYVNSELHRENGPAIEYDNGCKAWHLRGCLIYNDYFDNTCDFVLSDIMIKQIIKYKLGK